MEALDGMIIKVLSDRLFTPERLRVILSAYISRTGDADSERQRKLGLARKRQTEIAGKIDRLLELVANGLIDPDDPSLAEKMRSIKAERAAAEQEMAFLAGSTSGARVAITKAKLQRFAEVIRHAMRHEDAAFRKAYLRICVSEIVVDATTISVSGPEACLAYAAKATAFTHFSCCLSWALILHDLCSDGE